MIFYVLGNGFDLHYGLPTRYFDFKKYLITKGYRAMVEKVDDLIWRYRHYSPKDIEVWSEFEDMLMVFNDLDPDELYDEAFDNAETDDDRAGYWDSPSWNVNYYNKYIKVLKDEFDNWIREMNTKIIPDRCFNPVPGDAVLTFNYTTTVEDNFDIRGIQITHIHGTKNQEIMLGHNELPNPNLYTVIENEDSDYRDTTTRNAINEVLAQASQSYYKGSLQILHRYRQVFAQIPRFDKVVIMGLSCGQQDIIYVKEIIQQASLIEFYYYDDKAKENFDKILGNSNITVQYYKW